MSTLETNSQPPKFPKSENTLSMVVTTELLRILDDKRLGKRAAYFDIPIMPLIDTQSAPTNITRMNSGYTLIVDSFRTMEDTDVRRWLSMNVPIIVARTSFDAVNIIRALGLPYNLDVDYQLKEETIMDFFQKFEILLNRIPDLKRQSTFFCVCHSRNMVEFSAASVEARAIISRHKLPPELNF